MKEAILEDLGLERSKLIKERILALKTGDYESAEKLWQAIDAIDKRMKGGEKVTTEEMQKELEEAGYRFNFKPFDEGIVSGSGFWTPPPIIAHFEPPPLAVSRREMESYIIEKAYTHLQEKKRLAALEAENAELRSTLASMTTALSVLGNNLAEARKVLGWE